MKSTPLKIKDNMMNKIRYWRTHYNLDVSPDQYELFSKNSTQLKKIIPLIPFIKTLKLYT